MKTNVLRYLFCFENFKKGDENMYVWPWLLSKAPLGPQHINRRILKHIAKNRIPSIKYFVLESEHQHQWDDKSHIFYIVGDSDWKIVESKKNHRNMGYNKCCGQLVQVLTNIALSSLSKNSMIPLQWRCLNLYLIFISFFVVINWTK